MSKQFAKLKVYELGGGVAFQTETGAVPFLVIPKGQATMKPWGANGFVFEKVVTGDVIAYVDTFDDLLDSAGVAWGISQAAVFTAVSGFFFELNEIEIQAACSDETTALTAGTAKVTFRMPVAMTLTEVRASLTTAQASGNIFTVDINQNGASILGTKLTIDNTEKTSTTATTPATIITSALTDDAEITIDIDQIGDGTAKGLKITLIGTR